MDFRGRSSQAAPATAASVQPVSQSHSTVTPSSNQSSKFSNKPIGRLFKIATIVLLFSVTGLVIALTFLVTFNNSLQQRAVMKNTYQAVFLNNGQVYFGKIASLSDKTTDLRNIYYLQTSATSTSASATSTTTPSNVSLVKLGCELHGPYDRMLINNEQVTFWENIQDSSQVVKAIANYKTQNANNTCSTASQSSTDQAPVTTPTAVSPTSTTTPTTNTTTKKP